MKPWRHSARAQWWLTALAVGCFFEAASLVLRGHTTAHIGPVRVVLPDGHQVLVPVDGLDRSGDPQARIAIVLPFTEAEVGHQLDNLERWVETGAPSHPSTAPYTDLVFYYNRGPRNASDLDPLFRSARFLKSWASLASSFGSYSVHYADLDPSIDTYPAGPSHMFFSLFLTPAGRAATAPYKAIFWSEWDTFPIRAGWATKLYEEATIGEPFFVKGSIYHGRTLDETVASPSNWDWVSHINGNALYDTDDPAFPAFLETVVDQEPPSHYWKPFDVSIAKVFHSLPYSWQWQQRYAGRFQYSSFIRHLGFSIREDQISAARADSQCFLVHGKRESAGLVKYEQKFHAGIPTAEEEIEWTDRVPKSLRMSVLLRSYRDDIEYAVVAAESVARNIPNALETVIVVPTQDLALFKTRAWPAESRLVPEQDVLHEGHIQQKLTKLRADMYCKGDYILHLDSDMIISRPVMRKDILWLGRPMLLFAPYRELSESQSAWQEGTSHTLGRHVAFEFSRSAAHVYPRSIYARARAFVESKHRTDLVSFLATRRGKNVGKLADPVEASKLFSDFNFLGAFLYYHAREEMAFIPSSPAMRDEGVFPLVPPFVCQGNARLVKEMETAEITTGGPQDMAAKLRAGLESGDCSEIDHYVVSLLESADQAASVRAHNNEQHVMVDVQDVDLLDVAPAGRPKHKGEVPRLRRVHRG